MVHYKLTYFNGRGLGECARQLFALADQQYEDIRVTHEDFPEIKPNLPFGQLPLLNEDGKELAQSNAINRYLARKFGFAGKTPFEEALVDSLADQMTDYRVEIKPFVYTAYGHQKFGFLVGDSVTWIDLLLAEHASDIQSKVPEYLEGFPEVKAHMEKVRSIPKLKKWIETRPETHF
ncbi:glutathione S-transferase protein [Ancylostoma caninum]|uniref:Glutathione S-transferase protein n=1 Tax=Ancylostoma caninum TaxID=29170 RepID=A0A368H0I6_ANCCA|nr:glutathione S-transferase protein [Ancylostoma caninum]